MRLITLAAALPRLRDLCVHGIVTLVDAADSASVRELSDALYLIVLLRVSMISTLSRTVSVRTRSHPATSRPATTRSHTGYDAITHLQGTVTLSSVYVASC